METGSETSRGNLATSSGDAGDRSTGQSEPRASNDDGSGGAITLLLFPAVAIVFIVLFFCVRHAHQREAKNQERRMKKALPVTVWAEPTTEHGLVEDEAKGLEDYDDESEQTRECSLCLEPFLSGEFIRPLPCGHLFHQRCVDKWLFRKDEVAPVRSCPLCKADPMGAGQSAQSTADPETVITPYRDAARGCAVWWWCAHRVGPTTASSPTAAPAPALPPTVAPDAPVTSSASDRSVPSLCSC